MQVETCRTDSLSEHELIERILGRTLGELYPSAHEMQGEVALQADGVEGSVVRSFSLDVRRGEIVGLTGLLGMGYEEVPYLLFGSQRAQRRRADHRRHGPRPAPIERRAGRSPPGSPCCRRTGCARAPCRRPR